jgi:hypothetical protein
MRAFGSGRSSGPSLRPVRTADHRGPVWSRVAVINEDINIGIHPRGRADFKHTWIGKVDLNA